jgi:hypothetical protein
MRHRGEQLSPESIRSETALVFGLATRFAALPVLILSLVIQFSYQPLDQRLDWAILFGWFFHNSSRTSAIPGWAHGTRKRLQKPRQNGFREIASPGNLDGELRTANVSAHRDELLESVAAHGFVPQGSEGRL